MYFYESCLDMLLDIVSTELKLESTSSLNIYLLFGDCFIQLNLIYNKKTACYVSPE